MSTTTSFDPAKIYFPDFSNGFKTHPHNAEHIFLHSVYFYIANEISQKVLSSADDIDHPRPVHFYFVNMDQIDDKRGLSPPMLQYLQDHSYHSLFLSLYISQIIDKRIDFLQTYSANEVLSYVGFTDPREYPLRGKKYPDDSPTVFITRRGLSSSGPLHGVLATTRDELTYLINSLRKDDIKFTVKEITFPTYRKLTSFYDLLFSTLSQ